jgi:hypothetical protein
LNNLIEKLINNSIFIILSKFLSIELTATKMQDSDFQDSSDYDQAAAAAQNNKGG